MDIKNIIYIVSKSNRSHIIGIRVHELDILL